MFWNHLYPTWSKKSFHYACVSLSLVKDLNPCRQDPLSVTDYGKWNLNLLGGWIYSRTLKYLFKASFFSDSYLQYYLNRLYINLLGENWYFYVKSDIWAPPYSQNGMILTPREYLTVRLGVESGSSYRSIESSLLGVTPSLVIKFHFSFSYFSTSS